MVIETALVAIIIFKTISIMTDGRNGGWSFQTYSLLGSLKYCSQYSAIILFDVDWIYGYEQSGDYLVQKSSWKA